MWDSNYLICNHSLSPKYSSKNRHADRRVFFFLFFLFITESRTWPTKFVGKMGRFLLLSSSTSNHNINSKRVRIQRKQCLSFFAWKEDILDSGL